MAAAHGPLAETVFAQKPRMTEAVRLSAVERRDPPDSASMQLSQDKQILTSSSRAVLESAENWAQRVGGSDIGVRHLVASYVINPPAYHRAQTGKWGLKEAAWRPVFFKWVAERFTWEQWLDASERAAPAASRVAFEQTRVKGKSLAWPGDERHARAGLRRRETASSARHGLGFSTLLSR